MDRVRSGMLGLSGAHLRRIAAITKKVFSGQLQITKSSATDHLVQVRYAVATRW